MAIHLRPITSENWVECIELQPTVEQQQAGFVSPNVLSLAQAYAEPWWRPFAIYAGEVMVGFVMVGRWPETGVHPMHEEAQAGVDCILRFMIDARYQQRGYGRAALQATITQISALPGAYAIQLSYEPTNNVAARLYAGAGFKPTGRIVGGEAEVRLDVDTT